MVRFQSSLWKVVSFVLVSAVTSLGQESSRHFLPGDPLWNTPEVASAQGAVLIGIDNLYDFAVNSAKFKRPPVTPSLGINSLGEVPDSSWFTNRKISTMTIEDLKRGSRAHGAPAPPFEVVAAKTEGVTPGFRIRDARGLIYFVKVDPPSNPEMSTAADVIGALILYASGYNVPENYIAYATREQFRLASKATLTSAGKKHPLKQSDLDKILGELPVNQKGQIRIMASLSLEGKIIGPFRYEGTRSDDPNDLVPHEERGDLRGLAVLCAWLNHGDAKADNTMDTLVGKGAEARVRHHLLDFGAAFGSDSDIAKDPRHGQEFFLPTSRKQASKIFTAGLFPSDWETVHYPHNLPAAGNFTAKGFHPETWKPNYPNQAFLRMTVADAYWGTKLVMQFRNEQIEAIVSEGQFTDPRVPEYIASTLEKRRDEIGNYWFRVMLPLDDFLIDQDSLQYKDLAQQYKVAVSQRSLHFTWFHWDNANNKQGTSIREEESSTLPPEIRTVSEGSFIGCRIDDAVSRHPITFSFHGEHTRWNLVGITRSASTS